MSEQELTLKSFLTYTGNRNLAMKISHYRPHPKDGEGYIFTLCVSPAPPPPTAGTAVRVCAMRRAVCLLRLRRRTFLLIMIMRIIHVLWLFTFQLPNKRTKYQQESKSYTVQSPKCFAAPLNFVLTSSSLILDLFMSQIKSRKINA